MFSKTSNSILENHITWHLCQTLVGIKISVHFFLTSSFCYLKKRKRHYFQLFAEHTLICYSSVLCISKNERNFNSNWKFHKIIILTCLLSTDVTLTAMSFSRSWPLESDIARFLISNLNSTPWKDKSQFMVHCIIFQYTADATSQKCSVNSTIVEIPNGIRFYVWMITPQPNIKHSGNRVIKSFPKLVLKRYYCLFLVVLRVKLHHSESLSSISYWEAFFSYCSSKICHSFGILFWYSVGSCFPALFSFSFLGFWICSCLFLWLINYY